MPIHVENGRCTEVIVVVVAVVIPFTHLSVHTL